MFRWSVLLALGFPGRVDGANANAGAVAPPIPISTQTGARVSAGYYPGLPPGIARAGKDAGSLTLQNDVVQARWELKDGKPRRLTVKHLESGGELQFAGDLFEIVLSDGRRMAASQLEAVDGLRIELLAGDPNAARAAARQAGKGVSLVLRSDDGRLQVTWRGLLRDGANAVRQEIEVTATGGEVAIREVVWMEGLAEEARTEGTVDGSPIVAGGFFLGAESPHARNEVLAGPPSGAGERIVCRVPCETTLRPGGRLTQSFVVGVSPPGQMRRAFLYYLERERAHPYRPFLHYNSWYDIAWSPFALNETNCLEAIRLFGGRFIQAHDLPMQALVFDDGWDDPHTLWQFHAGFPNGFTPLAEACRAYGTHLGVWLSPFGGYGEPKRQRLEFGHAQGYETNATGFSLAGPKYHAAFQDACVRMIREYGVNHFKFDGIAGGMYANGSAGYLADTEAMRRLMGELRQEAPQVYINLTTGSWPSPFWLRYADSIWRQGGDMGLAGKGTRQQQWLTYRDQETFRNVVRKGPLYPLNSLMTQGVAYSRQGSAGDPTFNSAGFKDDVRAFFGSGTGLQELYIQPGKLTEEDWRVLAEAARWSRDHADVLVDTHWIGGDPGELEVYGWAAWSGERGTLSVRNPDETGRTIEIDIADALELPPGSPRAFHLKSPWKEDAAEPELMLRAGVPRSLSLGPFEVQVYDVIPADPVAP